MIRVHGLGDILDGFERELILERELGVRSFDCDRALLASVSVPLVAASKLKQAPSVSAVSAPLSGGNSAADASSTAVAAVLPPVPVSDSIPLGELVKEISVCKACGLHGQRTKTVPGQGNANKPDFMFIGEAPGEEEDRQGLAFVGAAGRLLTKMIAAMGYERDQVFIANVCKCRPPQNRTPTPQEMAVCLPYLKRQIEIVRPRVIVLLGRTAMNGLFPDAHIRRSAWYDYHGIPTIATYHPAYILRFDRPGNNAGGLRAAKLEVWNALKAALARIGKTPPNVKRS